MGKGKNLILVINNGSTSAKLAIFEDENRSIQKDVLVTPEDIKDFKTAMDQLEFRTNLVLGFIKENNYQVSDFSAIAARAGALQGIKSGAYAINDLMVDVLERFPTMQHANNLSAIIAYQIASSVGIPALTYDGDTMDEFAAVAKVTGLPQIKRVPTCHALNMKNVARSVAKDLGQPYESLNLIIAHLGGGVSLSAHQKGKIVDDIFDDEGPMSPQRAGKIPASALIDLCYDGGYTKQEMHSLIRGKGGLVALVGTQDTRELEKMAKSGNKQAELAYYAMAYQVAKGVGEMAAVLHGKVDQIIFTGGIANSKVFTGWIEEMVNFIAPIAIVPGEREMEALAVGALKVLRGEEAAKEYDIYPPNYTPRSN